MVLVLGPLYHLFTEEEKVQALLEAKRVLKPGGILMAAYILNEFAVIKFGFHDRNALESVKNGKLDKAFHVRNDISDLFSFERLEDITMYREKAGLKHLKTVAQDGPTNYMREDFKTMSPELFDLFMKYHLSTCERPDLLGAGCHVLDICTK